MGRINESACLIAEEASKVEAEVLQKSQESCKEKNTQWSMEMLESVTEFSEKLSSLKNEFALISDDFLGIKRNLQFIEKTAGSNGISEETIDDKAICGNVEYICSPRFKVGYGIFKGIVEEEAREQAIKCGFGYYCALCDAGNGTIDLTKEPPLKRGVVQETKALIDWSIKAFLEKRSELARCMSRTESFVSGFLSNLSTRVNLSLELSLSKTSTDQKKILSKMKTILEEAEKGRKITEKATKAVEILSLLFASFVVGEISSNFIIWGLQQAWPNQVPRFAYLGGFFLALGIAGIFFLPTYLYLKKKWR